MPSTLLQAVVASVLHYSQSLDLEGYQAILYLLVHQCELDPSKVCPLYSSFNIYHKVMQDNGHRNPVACCPMMAL